MGVTSEKRRYRLYVDESGSHAYSELDDPRKRYLGLTGCAFQTTGYFGDFCPNLSTLKQAHFPEHFSKDPDEPLIFHRTDIMHRKGSFWPLRDDLRRQEFDAAIIELFYQSKYGVFTVVLDKAEHLKKYGHSALHPYHYCLAALMERYCFYLNTYNAEGDILAESRNRAEDMQLKAAYREVYDRGTWFQKPPFFQNVLTSQDLKVKPKTADIAGLQLADLLAHPSKLDTLQAHGINDVVDGKFAGDIRASIESKYYRNAVDGKVIGFGQVLL